jgi:sulfatase modifying factor 1
MFELIHIDGGSFNMGSAEYESNEKPVHEVTLHGFYIGKYPLQQNEWFEVFKKSHSYNKGERYPVEQITWIEAIAFCNQLSITSNLNPCYQRELNYIQYFQNRNGYRLPTEAEWEFAALGGNSSKNCLYAGSNNINEVGWYKDNSEKHTHPVGELLPNELGIYDMSGNVYEMCWDVCTEYKNENQQDPIIRNESSLSERHALRGGNCFGFANRCRIKSRQKGLYKDFRQDFVGFRIAKNE